MKEGGIYLHIPYCRNKCLYCDFYSGGARIADWEKFALCLIRELESRAEEIDFLPATLYFGGGTPSLIPTDIFKKIVDALKSKLNVNKWNEFTIEVNPEDVTEQSCISWKNSGVNRVSVGVQTLNDEELSRIGRKHNSEDSIHALHLLRKYFDNISVDLIFGLPGQKLESYTDTLEKTIKLRPNHVSSYSLMLEPGTAMTLLVEQGKFQLPDEDEWLKMFCITQERLGATGYRRYEISNYALPGYESKHNRLYWMGNPYLGLGPSAHSYDGVKIRRANPNDIKGYVDWFSNEKGKFYKQEILTDQELMEEMIMTRLRMSEGLDITGFESKFGLKEKENLLQHSKNYISQGLLNFDGQKLSLTSLGFEISDLILTHLI